MKTRMPPGYRVDTPWLPQDVMIWLEGVVNDKMRVFEWGSGGSTVWFAQRCHSVMTVETDRTWISILEERARSLGLTNIKLFHIANVNDPYYARVIKLQPQKFDLIFIDGKERRRCAEAAIEKIAKGGIILFDNSDVKAHKEDIEPLEETLWPKTYIESEGVGGRWAATAWRKP
jgi:predicted O-methyltransferase YrrM